MELPCRWWPRPALAVVLLAAMGHAQAPAVIELRTVARTAAFGGNVQRIVVAADETRFLSVGEFGDILWWDLGKRELLRRFEPLGRYVGAVAIHPTAAWAVVAVSPAGDGPRAVFALDLENGDVRQVLACEVSQLAFSASGESLGLLEMKLLGERGAGQYEQCAVTYASEDLRRAANAQPRFRTAWEPWSRKWVHFPTPDGNAIAAPHGPASGERGEPCVSHSGAARGDHKWSRLRRFAPQPASWSLAPHMDTWIELTAIVDNGTMIAADLQGQLLVQGLAADDLTVRSGHRGETHALTFSPDGRFLAVQGLGAVRFVDVGGKEVAVLHGTHLVQPGPDGADFWILRRHGLRRWSAATGLELGEQQHWSQPGVVLLRTNPHRRAPLLDLFSDRAVCGPQSLWTLAPFAAIDGQPWGSDSELGRHAAQPMRRLATGQFEALPDHGDPGELSAIVVAPDGKVLCVTGRKGDPDMFVAPVCTVRAYRQNGESVVHTRFSSGPLWLTTVGDDVLLGAIDGTVHRLRGSDLGAIGEQTFTPPLLQLMAFDRDRLLATDGPSLQLLDATTLAVVQTLPLPADFDGIDVFALAPDRRHLAVARGSEVRILAIE